MDVQAKAHAFLGEHGLTAESIDMGALVDTFIDEMERGLAGKAGSLAMIPTYVTINKPVPPGKPVIVMDAGGSNLRVGIVTFDADGTPTIEQESFRKYRMPGIDKELGKNEFFDAMAGFLEPVIDRSDCIGFCFSYPAEITPEVDGKLLYWTKEIKAKEVEGEYIGANLAARLEKKGHGKKRIVILNDTIATLLAGKSFGTARKYESYTGVIVGTGSNTAYVERNDRIGKRQGLKPDGSMAINLESGGFAKCPRTDIDETFDATTDNPGKQAFEKMISGGYLGGVGLHVLKTAAAEGLFSATAAKTIAGWTKLTTKEMDDFLWNPFRPSPFDPPAFNEDDRTTVMVLAAEVIKRAAVLVAVNIAAPIIKSGTGRNPLHPVCVTIDGSTFYKTNNLKSMVEANLRTILGRRGIFFETVQVDEAPVIGAAVAGLTV